LKGGRRGTPKKDNREQDYGQLGCTIARNTTLKGKGRKEINSHWTVKGEMKEADFLAEQKCHRAQTFFGKHWPHVGQTLSRGWVSTERVKDTVPAYMRNKGGKLENIGLRVVLRGEKGSTICKGVHSQVKTKEDRVEKGL